MLRRWRLAILTAICGVLIAAAKLSDGAPVAAAIILSIFAGLAFAVSPGFFPRHERAADVLADGRPVVYWRPGCPFCLRLRAQLGPDSARLHWVDIWQDPEGAAAVRAITGGTRRCRRWSWTAKATSTRTRPGCAPRSRRPRRSRSARAALSPRASGMLRPQLALSRRPGRRRRSAGVPVSDRRSARIPAGGHASAAAGWAVGGQPAFQPTKRSKSSAGERRGRSTTARSRLPHMYMASDTWSAPVVRASLAGGHGQASPQARHCQLGRCQT